MGNTSYKEKVQLLKKDCFLYSTEQLKQFDFGNDEFKQQSLEVMKLMKSKDERQFYRFSNYCVGYIKLMKDQGIEFIKRNKIFQQKIKHLMCDVFPNSKCYKQEVQNIQSSEQVIFNKRYIKVPKQIDTIQKQRKLIDNIIDQSYQRTVIAKEMLIDLTQKMSRTKFLSLQQLVKEQQKIADRQLQKLLGLKENKDWKMQFDISDMVRGICFFQKEQDAQKYTSQLRQELKNRNIKNRCQDFRNQKCNPRRMFKIQLNTNNFDEPETLPNKDNQYNWEICQFQIIIDPAEPEQRKFYHKLYCLKCADLNNQVLFQILQNSTLF